MKNRSKVSHLKLFKYTYDFLKFEPKYIKIDFEMAGFSAILITYHETKIAGCFLYFFKYYKERYKNWCIKYL